MASFYVRLVPLSRDAAAASFQDSDTFATTLKMADENDASRSDVRFWCASELLVDQIPDDLALFLHSHGEPAPSDHRYALIIVNTPLCRREKFEMLWSKCGILGGPWKRTESERRSILAVVRLCADGGANRLYDLFRTDEDARARSVRPAESPK